MAKHEYLHYNIHLTDKELVDQLQGQTHAGGAVGAVIMAPDTAATTYSAVKLTSNISAFLPPCLTSEWFTVGNDFPTHVASFDRKSGGWFGIPWLFGSTIHFHWRGLFVYAPPVVPSTVDGPIALPENLKERRWIDGFELPPNGDSASVSGNGEIARMASRHVDGYGLALRSSIVVRTHLVDENIVGLTPQYSWERFYIRLIAAPAAQTRLWKASGSVSPQSGVALYVTPSGQLAVFDVDTAGNISLHGTLNALTVGQWYRVDIRLAFGTNGMINPPATIEVYLNGVMQLAITALLVTMSIAGRRHTGSDIGTTTANTLAIDVDDWMSAESPALGNGQDWLNGSKMQLVSPTGFGAANVWAGDWRTLLQNPTAGATSTLTNSTAGAILSATTDAAQSVDALGNSLGVASMIVAINAATGGASGQLGYSLAGAAAVMAAIVQTGVSSWQRVFYRCTGVTVPVDVTPIELVFAHGAGASACTVKALFAVAEVLGVFGREDVLTEAGVTPDPLPVGTGIHNAPYPRTPWARRTGPPPLQPVMVKTGTYVGSGVAGHDLTFRVPPGLFLVRPTTGALNGTTWWTSLLGAHFGIQEAPLSTLMPQALIDPAFVPVGGVSGNDLPTTPATAAEAMQLASALAYDPLPDGSAKHTDPATWADYLTDPVYYFKRMLGWQAEGGPDEADYGLYAVPPSGWIGTQQQQTILRITGTDAASNAVGVTYAYLAFCDPAMRFLLNGALANHKGVTDITTALVDSHFTADAGFFMQEVLNGGATARAYYKGPGHAPSSLSVLNAAELASALAFGAGTLTSKSAFHSNAFMQIAFALFRKDDGSGDAGVVRVVQITSYVGDGAASRTLALTPVSGRRPMWALIVPHTGAAFMRDPQHTGTISMQFPATVNAATGIVGGGIDTISIGSALNTVGVTYDVLAFPGAVAAGNAGWSGTTEEYPVDPNPPTNPPGPWDSDLPEPGPEPTPDPEPPPAPVPDPLPPTGPLPGIADDLEAACKPDTIRIVNLALSRLGITLQVQELATDTTIEAVTARLVYKEAVETTLRDFPWPFATRYVQLALVGATPNSDWAYSYRQPNDCLFERRLVVARTGAIDPTAVPFKLSSDDTGGLIFCNQANAVLEYTARPKCPHTRSEPLFREAVCWRLAAAMGPGLSRMPEKVAECLAEYQKQLALAALVVPPGNPGEAPTLSAFDTTTPARVANLTVANWALVRIGAQTVRNLLTTDQSREAQAVRLIFEQELQATLRDFPWPFATVYASLTLVAGTPTVRLNNDWRYSYRLPTDVLFVRRIVPDTGRGWNRNPPTYKVGQDATGKLLYTDLESTTLAPLTIEYTTRPANCVSIADALFQDAFAWRLASSLAPSLAQRDPDVIEQQGRGPRDRSEQKERPASGAQLRARAAVYAMQRYVDVLATARTSTANEQQQDLEPGDADWIRGRE